MHVCDVEITMAKDGTYKVSMLEPAFVAGERAPRSEVWGLESIPDGLRALAYEIERKARREFTRVFEEDGA